MLTGGSSPYCSEGAEVGSINVFTELVFRSLAISVIIALNMRVDMCTLIEQSLYNIYTCKVVVNLLNKILRDMFMSIMHPSM